VLLEWSKHWLLSFNIARCKVVNIGTGPYVGNYCLNRIHLELLENIRDLGIQVIQSLIHTDIVIKKVFRILGLISKTFEYKDPDVIVRLFTTLVRPIIEYNNVLFIYLFY